jgi:hypothetical protein
MGLKPHGGRTLAIDFKPSGRAGLVARAADRACGDATRQNAVRPQCPAALRFTRRIAYWKRSTIPLAGGAGQANAALPVSRKSLTDYNFRRRRGVKPVAIGAVYATLKEEANAIVTIAR